MANCFHTALEMPPCRNNSEHTTDARSKTAPESNSKAKEGKWRILDEVLDPKGRILQKWNMIFAASCVLAVLLDPLFLYIPILNDDMKCIGVDKNMKIVAVVFRSFTDLIYIVKIIFQICKLKKSKEIWESCMMLVKGGAMKGSGGSQAPSKNADKKCLPIKDIMGPLLVLVVDILTVLPIPQVVIIIFLTKMRGSRLNTIIMNSLVLFQYVPRVFCIYLAGKEFKIPSCLEKWESWLKGGLSFFMYILASNVIGAFWYFFSIQQMIHCWQSACHSLNYHNECKSSALLCHNQRTIGRTTLVYDLCPINPQNVTLFDFGIFLNVLQPGIAGSTNYLQKLTNCLLWALRNLSSFGSNLEPSINPWENLFATSVSITGLLLFLYLLGKLQIYMAWETAMKQERWTTEVREKKEVKRLIKLFEPKIDSWLEKNDLDPSRFKSVVETELVNLALKSNKEDVDENEIFPNLSRDLRDQIQIEKDAKEIDSKRKT
ncbi:cyclic nucleotide-gated ion channel 1-like [Rosa chinensis]|uniref:cyclic nucleotide-gated ion channel 1-like n=1 Tax=Rosa chinensis TaxID=74649 RepID=UPI001AD8AEE7|nr:cyclic nucleotide-gated ion channel 1-like [Rosa chinensis]